MNTSTVERSTQVYLFKTTHPRTPPMYPTIETTSLERALRLAVQRHHFKFEQGSYRLRVDRADIKVHLLGSPTQDVFQSSRFIGDRDFWDARQGYVSLDMANKSATIVTDLGDNSEVYSGVCRATVMDVLEQADWFPVKDGAWEVHVRPQGGANYCRYRIERGDL